ncbi:MAG: acetate--CoA ligase family protein, partial [Candidatus Aenigmatarchaeota archaeon]
MALLDMFKGKHQKGSAAPKADIKRPTVAKKPVKHISKVKPKPKTAAKPVHNVVSKPVQKAVIAKPVPSPKLDDEKAWELLKQARFPVAPFMFVRKEADIQAALKKVGIPAVMKVSGPNIIHKTDLGGIKKDISTEEQAKIAFTELMKIKGAEKVQFQKQLSGLELIVGAKSDSQFGTIVSVGLGGIYVEI